MAKKTKLKLIGKKTFSVRGQNHDLRSRYELVGHRLKLKVHLDSSYYFQHAVVAHVWSEDSLEWNTVATLHWSETPNPRQGDRIDHSALTKAERELLKRAVWVLAPLVDVDVEIPPS